MAPEAQATVKILICLEMIVTTDNPAARGQKDLQNITWGCVSRGGAGAVPGGDRRTPGTNIPVPAHGQHFHLQPPAHPALIGGAHHKAKRGQMPFPAQHRDPIGSNSASVYKVL